MDIVLRDVSSVSGMPMPLQLVDTSGSTPFGEGTFRPTPSVKKQKVEISRKRRNIDIEESEDDNNDEHQTRQINRRSSSQNFVGSSRLHLRSSVKNSTAIMGSDLDNTERVDVIEESGYSDRSEGCNDTSDDEDAFEESAGEEDQEIHSEYEDGGGNAKLNKSARRHSRNRNRATAVPLLSTTSATSTLGFAAQAQAITTAPPSQLLSTNTGGQVAGRPAYNTVKQWAAAFGVFSVKDLNRFVAPFLVSVGLPAWKGNPTKWFTVGRHQGDREKNNMIWEYIRTELAAGR